MSKNNINVGISAIHYCIEVSSNSCNKLVRSLCIILFYYFIQQSYTQMISTVHFLNSELEGSGNRKIKNQQCSLKDIEIQNWSNMYKHVYFKYKIVCLSTAAIVFITENNTEESIIERARILHYLSHIHF